MTRGPARERAVLSRCGGARVEWKIRTREFFNALFRDFTAVWLLCFEAPAGRGGRRNNVNEFALYACLAIDCFIMERGALRSELIEINWDKGRYLEDIMQNSSEQCIVILECRAPLLKEYLKYCFAGGDCIFETRRFISSAWKAYLILNIVLIQLVFNRFQVYTGKIHICL